MMKVFQKSMIWGCVYALFTVVLLGYANVSLPMRFLQVFGHSTDSSPPTMLPWWDGGECICDQKGNCEASHPSSNKTFDKLSEEFGTCGRRAAADGDNQKVISFSLFGTNSFYWDGFADILKTATVLYPGWKVWIYTDPRNRTNVLCPLLHKYNHLRICDVNNLPHPLNNISKVHPMIWRDSPLGHPKVEALLIRDSDSNLTEREQKAVEEWLASGKTFHVMRDHPKHQVPILGGMWGARWGKAVQLNLSPAEKNISLSHPMLTAKNLSSIRTKLFIRANNTSAKGIDQDFLAEILWPSMWSLMAHDSFFCKRYSYGSRPFPTQRVNGTFVGDLRYPKPPPASSKREFYHCPPVCRPSDHQDWIHC